MKELHKPETFLSALRRLGPDLMVNYYLLEGVPALFADDWERYCLFKKEISQKFGVHPKTVMLVGSGRWGFSTSPDKFPREFDKGKKASDLDVVVADPMLFDHAWRDIRSRNFPGTHESSPRMEACLFRAILKELGWRSDSQGRSLDLSGLAFCATLLSTIIPADP